MFLTRRRFLPWMLLVSLVALAGYARAEARTDPIQRVAGRVYLDGNANGRFDPGETGLPDVPVTDGVGFVRTGPDGRYEMVPRLDPLLGDESRRTVSVSFPSGTWPTAGWYRRLADVADPGGVDFALRPDQQAWPFLFVHATDPHVPRGGKEKFIGFRQEMAALAGRVKFAVVTGDLVDLSDSHPFKQGTAEYAFLADQTRDFPVPLFVTAGNHDAAGVQANKESGWETTHPGYGYGYYTQTVGPLRWSFTYGCVHFVGIDFLHVDEKGAWQWGPSDSALAWLREDLAQVKPGSRILLFVHSPRGRERVKGDPASVVQVPTDLLRQYNVEHIFAGHSHNERTGRFGGVPLTESGSLSQIFSEADRDVGYRLVAVGPYGLDTFYKATGKPHAVTVDSPRHKGTIGADTVIRGGFYDPDGAIRSLTVTLGGASASVPFAWGPTACRFQVKPDLANVKPGKHPLEIVLSDGRQTWTWRHEYEVAPGK